MANVRQIVPPRGEDPLSWASRHDQSPRIIPYWPTPEGFVLILVTEIAPGQHECHAVSTDEELDSLAIDSTRGVFFTIPTVLLE